MEFKCGNKTYSKRDDIELRFHKWDKLTMITSYDNPHGSGSCYRYFDVTCDKDGELTIKEKI